MLIFSPGKEEKIFIPSLEMQFINIIIIIIIPLFRIVFVHEFTIINKHRMSKLDSEIK